ncbi:hypothetical protein FOXG_19597 [Fusarium oxysporum f. sp. lycopersici 4287]|uniref:Uncharacterized protein n=1 Tax=Fusarium oxysporum f. sp. lycopersici (strain 4287 / CBS 123668 / FGSC 9935 / NRRL 34936) TaxID=426428 RepID=A0A0J9V3Y9_FUSO4|nr:hypothetical protein FOXG_19597 [Fusarium oxysporum f. sp. lycopersici 4287]XP_018244235.1 hypothetical protein FOXG_19597 [Fusarium oxysporum f. sp. lycopersici 4287]XP_018244236.1 hypothetical protein FOXG_19597 [Fusarium oxysporum f. sp. lycopersici 4287]XP_018244237.1 hypothetical protein FOXG_19597 [Fusarium oxysporum f. sp. lycopersici 4287]KNB06189.1 hypothetical protein FOXG_19597 [Fusarium oxysporum f. sp. lycopersici 4287]KNB06190.1 hypothetical protein FOXG_19597 [Fusarium oxyspo
MEARSEAIRAPAMSLRSRSPTQRYYGATSVCSITPRDSTLHTSKDNSIFQSFGKDFKISIGLKECARRILRLNTLPSQATSKKKLQGDPQHGHPNCTANERVTLNQHTGGLNCASSATTPSCTAIVTTDGGHVQGGGAKIQQQSRPALHVFGHRRSAEKQPLFKTVHFGPDLDSSFPRRLNGKSLHLTSPMRIRRESRWMSESKDSISLVVAWLSMSLSW